MNKYLFIFLLVFSSKVIAQSSSGNFTVGGDINLYYPVSFYDANWSLNIPTDLTLGRSSVHTNTLWRGSLQAHFSFHTTNYGHGSQFIEADIKSYDHGINNIYSFIGGWQDVTWCNGDSRIIIWLKGGGTTYYFSANGNVLPVVYDGVANAAVYTTTNCGTQFTPKSAPDTYVNNFGTSAGSAYFNTNKPNFFNGSVGIGTLNTIEKLSISGNLFLTGLRSEIYGTDRNHMIVLRGRHDGTIIDETNYYQYGDHVFNTGGFVNYQVERLRIKANGNVGIGTTNPTEKLSVNGNIRAKKLIVTQNGWPDYVFSTSYKLRPITEVADYIQANKHLPDMPSAKDVEEKGLDIGKTQAALLKKIEELTLYLIEVKKDISVLQSENKSLKAKIGKFLYK